MRLLRITVRNYRRHRETSVDFDAARNLIGGPNESGKSTLAEAIHRALFLRAKTGGALQKEMVSSLHLGDPEVLLSFEAAGACWELEKRFAGTSKGSTRLTRDGGSTLRDDEAETKLAELLQIQNSGKRATQNELASLWSHLWVWQGKSIQDPALHVADQHDRIVRHLQQNGISSLLESLADQQAAERIETAWSGLYTPTGKLKAGSPPEEARLEFEKAEAAVARAQEISERLNRAAEDHLRAESEIATINKALPDLRQHRATTLAKIQQATELRREHESRTQAVGAALLHLQQLETNDRAIRDLRERLTTAEAALAPSDVALATLTATETDARKASESADAAHGQLAENLRILRLSHEAAAAAVISFEKDEVCELLLARSLEAATAKAELDHARLDLSGLPSLSPADVAQLRALDTASGQAKAALEAIATGVELITSPHTVELDGRNLTPGDEHILTASGELVIDGATRLRIRPGGGKSLEAARALLRKSQDQLRAALDALALQSIDQAVAALEQRRTLEQQIHGLEARWFALGGAKIAADLDQAKTARDAALQHFGRRQELAGDAFIPPSDLTIARAQLSSAIEMLQRTEADEAIASQNASRLRQRLQTAGASLQHHRETTLTSRQAVRDLETMIRTREENHGDESSRTIAIVAARENHGETGRLLTAATQALAALQPEQLDNDLERFNRAIATQENRLREAENQRLITRDRLTLDGSTDPHAELLHAQARLRSTCDRHLSERRRAQAIDRLHQLFQSSRESMHRTLVKPLADRIEGYLQCLFGPGAGVTLQLTNEGLGELEFIRPGDPSFSFETLSGGAREQVAAAVRLAVAEILASGHDGCLPVVFDDAFAFSDPGRLGSLQRMLDLAATRGLQIIVLTCTPADYSGLGAQEAGL